MKPNWRTLRKIIEFPSLSFMPHSENVKIEKVVKDVTHVIYSCEQIYKSQGFEIPYTILHFSWTSGLEIIKVMETQEEVFKEGDVRELF